jgi:hypothetical protein
MVANELVKEGVVVMCDYLVKECQHISEKIKEKNIGNYNHTDRNEEELTC